jgi:hypothetical protein
MAYGGSGRVKGGDSRRSPQWEGAPLTDFVITTVNVPDRLDMQEVRAREEEDDEPSRPARSMRMDSYTLGLWFRRLLVLAVLGGLAFFGWQSLKPVYDELAAPRIAERLTQALGQRVIVGESEIEFASTPRLSLRNIDLAGQLLVDEVILNFSWDEAMRAVRSRSWAWGEAQVPSLDLTHVQVQSLIDALPGLTAGLPPSVSLLRLASVGFPDYPLLSGRYEVTLRRADDGRFGPIVVESLAADAGTMRMRLMPRAGDGPVGFQLEAAGWRAPVGPAVAWTDLIATGYFGPHYLVVEKYAGSGFFGVTQGALAAAHDAEWALTGTAQAININLEAVFRHLRGPTPAGALEDTSVRAPLTGLATMDLRLAGRAATLQEAVDRAALAGPIEVRYAQLNGINLGLAATQGIGGSGAGGGLTRFTELDAMLVAAGDRVTFSDIKGRAGALATRGEIVANDDLTLSGAVRVELGTARIVAPILLQVRGTALAPQFGR